MSRISIHLIILSILVIIILCSGQTEKKLEHSTQTDGYETLKSKSQLDVIFTDFKKAFDKVDHDILLTKLNKFGLSDGTLKMFASYLENRFLVVKHNRNTSGKYEANSGVPQGSNLGPLLFVMFINDLPSVLKYSSCLLFADDLKIFKKNETIRDSVMLQKDLESVCEWSCKNKLFINLKKCSVMRITKLREPIIFDYMMQGEGLQSVREMRDLGITYDYRLSFSNHVKNIIKSANRMLGFIVRQTSNFSNIEVIKILYYALVRSKLEFGSEIWLGEYQTTHFEVKKIQNKFLRHMYYKKYRIYPDYKIVRTSQLRNEFKMLPLNSRRNQNILIFLFKLLNHKINSPELLSRVRFNVPARRTRNSPMFNIPLVCTTARSPLIIMLRLANKFNLLMDIDWTVSLNAFREIVARYIRNFN